MNILGALKGNSAVVRIVNDRRIFALQKGFGRNKGGDAPIVALLTSHRLTSEVLPAGVKRVGEPMTGSEGAGVGIMIGERVMIGHSRTRMPLPRDSTR